MQLLIEDHPRSKIMIGQVDESSTGGASIKESVLPDIYVRRVPRDTRSLFRSPENQRIVIYPSFSEPWKHLQRDTRLETDLTRIGVVDSGNTHRLRIRYFIGTKSNIMGGPSGKGI